VTRTNTPTYYEPELITTVKKSYSPGPSWAQYYKTFYGHTLRIS